MLELSTRGLRLNLNLVWKHAFVLLQVRLHRLIPSFFFFSLLYCNWRNWFWEIWYPKQLRRFFGSALCRFDTIQRVYWYGNSLWQTPCFNQIERFEKQSFLRRMFNWISRWRRQVRKGSLTFKSQKTKSKVVSTC